MRRVDALARRLAASLAALALWPTPGASQSAAAPSALTATAAAPTPLAIAEVRPGVFVHIGAVEDWAPAHGGDVANLGFVVGSRCVAVIDTGGTPAVGLALRAAIERTTPLPVCYVIITHAHPDHLFGSAAFRNAPASASAPRPQFVGSAKLRRTLGAREPHYRNALQRDFGIRAADDAFPYPDVEVAGALELDLGGRLLTLQAWPTAHTDNDLTVYDRRTRTLFASDLLFVTHLPVLDGSLRGWLGVMDELRRLDVATVVPGHGAVSDDWPGATDAQGQYLQRLLRETRHAIKALVPIREAVERVGIPIAKKWLLTDRFHRRNVTAAYAELEWEDDPAANPGVDAAANPSAPARPAGR